jgi:hypothetical protein
MFLGLLKQSGVVFHRVRCVHYEDCVVMNCCCLLTGLERAVKKLPYKMDVMRLGHIKEERHTRAHLYSRGV